MLRPASGFVRNFRPASAVKEPSAPPIKACQTACVTALCHAQPIEKYSSFHSSGGLAARREPLVFRTKSPPTRRCCKAVISLVLRSIAPATMVNFAHAAAFVATKRPWEFEPYCLQVEALRNDAAENLRNGLLGC